MTPPAVATTRSKTNSFPAGNACVHDGHVYGDVAPYNLYVLTLATESPVTNPSMIETFFFEGILLL